MKAISLVFIAFFALASANLAALQELAQLDKDPFASVILSAISLNIKSKQATEEVAELLDNILQDLLADIQSLENYYATRKQGLSDSISQGKELIAAYEATIAAIEDSINTDTRTRATEEETLANTNAALKYEQKRLIDLDQNYQNTVPVYDADIQDLTRAITAVSSATSKMETFKVSNIGAASLIQMTSNAKQDLKTVADAVSVMKKKLSRQSNLYTPLVRELLDLSSTVDQSRADRVVALLNQLVDLLKKASSDLQSQRAVFIGEYDRNKKEAQDNIIEYQARVALLTQNIASLTIRINQANNDLAQTKTWLQAARAKLTDDEAKLNKLEEYYNDQKPRYERLTELLRKIIDYYNQNVAAIDEYTHNKIEGQL